VKAFLDTSVLVPVFYGAHPHHAASLDVFTRFGKADPGCRAHSLVETYSIVRPDA
jgi:predicted nucleic acid-binding protein